MCVADHEMAAVAVGRPRQRVGHIWLRHAVSCGTLWEGRAGSGAVGKLQAVDTKGVDDARACHPRPWLPSPQHLTK